MIGDMGVDTFLEVSTDIGVDVFFPNKEEAAVLTGSSEPETAAKRLSRLFDGALIVLKLDADGALICEDGSVQRVPPTSNRLVDATGAGDSFAVEAAGFAVGVAEWVIEHPGARPNPDAALSAVLARP
jgi:sugar/nucleoside kinase (ribokinase family)